MCRSPKPRSRICTRSHSPLQNVPCAKRFVTELREQCLRLTEFPLGGAIPKDRILRSLDLRYIVHKDYLLFYSVDEALKTVSVLAIFSAKKDYLRVMRKFI